LGDFDPDLSKLIDRALAREREQRFGSADELADALEVIQEKQLDRRPTRRLAGVEKGTTSKRWPNLGRQNVLLADFTEKELAQVMALSRQESHSAGDAIIREGTGGSTMYVVVEGLVSVCKRSGSKEIEIEQIGPGGCFGEMAVVSQMPRAATVIALQPTEVIAISGAVLRSASAVISMKLYRNIACLLSERIRQVDARVVTLVADRPGNSSKSSTSANA
jgi:CRP-like cAMP-binding protein